MTVMSVLQGYVSECSCRWPGFCQEVYRTDCQAPDSNGLLVCLSVQYLCNL